METKDFGRLFFHTINLNGRAPFLHRFSTYEVDSPYRYSNSIILRLPRKLGVVLGWWRRSPAASIQQHLSMAVSAMTAKQRAEYVWGPDLLEPRAVMRVNKTTGLVEELSDEEIAELNSMEANGGNIDHLIVRDDEAF